jgi:hypothetical protein
VADDPWKKPDPNAPPPPPAQGPPAWSPPPGYGPPPPGYNPPPPGYGPPPPGYGPPGGYYGPPPGYGPGYGPPVYAQPGANYDPNNPYGGPLPKRGGAKKLVLILGTVGLLVLGGCGIGIYFLVDNLSKNADRVNAFLADVRDSQFDSAYDQLCPGIQASQLRSEFVRTLQEAADRGHAVISYDINSVNTTSGTGGSSRTAGGSVNFTDGQSRFISFDLGKSDGKLCISYGYEDLD